MIYTPELLVNFYSTFNYPPPVDIDWTLSGGGGPLGYNIHYALEIDFLINSYKCDAIIETGTNVGDSTEYFAKQYPNITIITCEIDSKHLEIAYNRLEKYPNVHVLQGSSEEIVLKFQNHFKIPFYFLDAHLNGDAYWPLPDEIKNIKKGIVSIDDFDINNSFYKYDTYVKSNGEIIKCDLQSIPKENISTPIYSNNPSKSHYPIPIVPPIYQAGRGYFGVGIKEDYFKYNKFFKKLN